MGITETLIDIPAEHERNVCGQFDAYLKKIERTLHVTMIARDGEIKLIGPEKTIGQAKSVFNNLIQLSYMRPVSGMKTLPNQTKPSLRIPDIWLLHFQSERIAAFHHPPQTGIIRHPLKLNSDSLYN